MEQSVRRLQKQPRTTFKIMADITLQQKYNQSFKYSCIRNINKIMFNHSQSSLVIKFKDDLIYNDDDQTWFERFYSQPECNRKLQYLSEHYAWHVNIPSLFQKEHQEIYDQYCQSQKRLRRHRQAKCMTNSLKVMLAVQNSYDYDGYNYERMISQNMGQCGSCNQSQTESQLESLVYLYRNIDKNVDKVANDSSSFSFFGQTSKVDSKDSFQDISRSLIYKDSNLMEMQEMKARTDRGEVSNRELADGQNKQRYSDKIKVDQRIIMRIHLYNQNNCKINDMKYSGQKLCIPKKQQCNQLGLKANQKKKKKKKILQSTKSNININKISNAADDMNGDIKNQRVQIAQYFRRATHALIWNKQFPGNTNDMKQQFQLSLKQNKFQKTDAQNSKSQQIQKYKKQGFVIIKNQKERFKQQNKVDNQPGSNLGMIKSPKCSESRYLISKKTKLQFENDQNIIQNLNQNKIGQNKMRSKQQTKSKIKQIVEIQKMNNPIITKELKSSDILYMKIKKRVDKAMKNPYGYREICIE